MKKLLAVDLDGTLLNENHEISDENLQAIQMFQQRGGKVAVVTGRNLRAAQSYADQVAPHMPLVCFNGAYIWDPKSEKALKTKALKTDQVEKLIAIAQAHGLHYRYYDLETIYAAESQRSLYQKYEGGMGPRMQYFSDEILRTYYREAGLSVPKFVMHTDNMEKLMAARRQIELDADWEVAQSWTGLIEVMPKGINKGSALKRICQHLSLSLEETVAVGDQENDSAMIQAAGIGVAVENAAKSLKKVADAVTISHRDSAIAAVIKTYCMEE